MELSNLKLEKYLSGYCLNGTSMKVPFCRLIALELEAAWNLKLPEMVLLTVL